ncbi:MAG: tripartite tricarboxylate transporter substrate binding protein [Hydrogenophaga sp.]|uniref:tripartite tricarboxylate transporter substrate binding protein n=1 Tax=Hydrogenophaga sp. TaxID=1904254 RepID=UPI0025C447E9|nr:tripartite tricarboxylate transporter substrate binding protein [Hydrogenophaga sp.]MBT9553224.1 tripartite tricarboxylate transporter substrate binding protein [Hydrogenophaga sp.]
MSTRRPAALSRRQVLTTAAALAAPAILPAHLFAQDKFPSRPIKLIAPWPTGGSSDAVMRAFAESAGKALGTAVIIENKPGAGGTLGASAMVTAAPDGYTLTQLPLGIYRLPHMQTMGFDPVKDITHIACLTGYTFGIACTADAPFKTLKDMVAYAKANPGKLEYGHTGTGTTPHLAIEEFSEKAGIQLNPIPFKGSAEIMQAILGGHIRVMSGTTEFAPHVQSGKLRLLATLGRQRNKAFPDVPTVKESGWDTITESPFGIGGPKGMDPAVVKTLHDAFKKTLEDPAVLATLDKFFQPVIYMNSADYTAYGERTFKAEKATIERLGLAKKG